MRFAFMTEKMSGTEILLLAGGTLVALFIVFLVVVARRPVTKRVISRIRKRRWQTREQFLRKWQRGKKDFPGCYVVLIYDKKVIFNPFHYDDIYVGQSVHVRQRVFSHLKGHGNGDVYYGLKSGCKVYVILIKCRRKNLNRYEKDLIAAFHATSSLNVTRGGSARRY